ncbi:hypothetical protein fHeYen901_81 [Yersinia phage fHe-Yen9-01]|uniref:Uncharacterized protein n=1 Tax=Yersinia phage fHe-Yen9-01 TaxID=1965363 RepID=A0A1V0DXH8_9CAUD|nr:hypothetical protein KNT60_gp080 [Yersinia phage fHe-Yen9-01]ARB05854.1 hypothetical protein fHeYen901_81 [Yersinia phage fHe-Yen9-01]
MRLSEFVVKKWAAWDDIGDGICLYDCVLNTDFFIGAESDYDAILDAKETSGYEIDVTFFTGDCDFVIEINVGDALWTYKPKIKLQIQKQ